MAAAYARAVLCEIKPKILRTKPLLANLSETISPSQACFTVPFERDLKFIGREDIIVEINRRFQTQRRVALAGIGGIGWVPL